MERIKVSISKTMSKGIEDSLCNYGGDKDELVVDYLNGKSNGYFNSQIAPVVMNMDSKEFVGILRDLVDVEVVETMDEKKERWNRVIEGLLES